MKQKKKLKVGFDLDGVLLYNPARVARPILAFLNQGVLRKKKLEFYVPKGRLSRLLWYFIHKSSLFIAPGYEDLKELIKEGKIEAYLITSRYSSLKGDFDKWMRKLEAPKYFKAFMQNETDEQPHEFKKRMIEKLDLDAYVEDNWDIIALLSQKKKGKKNPHMLWVSNIFDGTKKYEHKFVNFRGAVRKLREMV